MLEHNSYLIQRIKAPYLKEVKSPLQALIKFGLAATGLPKEAKELISTICVFDYMGSSEYEFGAIPKALRQMTKRKLVAITPTIAFSYRDYRNSKDITGNRTVYIIAPELDIEEVQKRIENLAIGKENCKERTQFSASLAEAKYDADILGWFDLDNHFMFFKDVKMFKDWCAAFDTQE